MGTSAKASAPLIFVSYWKGEKVKENAKAGFVVECLKMAVWGKRNFIGATLGYI